MNAPNATPSTGPRPISAHQSPDHSAPSLAPSPYRTQPRDAHDNFRNGATSRLTRPQETCIYTLRIRAASCTPVIWRSSIIDAGSSMSSERAVSRSLKPETLRGESWSHDCCIRQSRVVVGVRPECRADINLQGLVLSLRNHQSSSPTSLGVRDARSPVRRADCHNGDCMSAAEPDVWAVGGRLLRTAAWQTVRPGPSRDWIHRPPPAGCTLERAVTALSAVVVILASALSISPVDIDDLLSPFPPISPFPHLSSPYSPLDCRIHRLQSHQNQLNHWRIQYTSTFRTFHVGTTTTFPPSHLESTTTARRHG